MSWLQTPVRRAAARRAKPAPRSSGPGPCYVPLAILAIQLVTNMAVMGASFDIDGGQQLFEG